MRPEPDRWLRDRINNAMDNLMPFDTTRRVTIFLNGLEEVADLVIDTN